MIKISCDFCGDELENVTSGADYLNVRLGTDGNVLKQLCRNCANAIDNARGKQ